MNGIDLEVLLLIWINLDVLFDLLFADRRDRYYITKMFHRKSQTTLVNFPAKRESLKHALETLVAHVSNTLYHFESSRFIQTSHRIPVFAKDLNRMILKRGVGFFQLFLKSVWLWCEWRERKTTYWIAILSSWIWVVVKLWQSESTLDNFWKLYFLVIYLILEFFLNVLYLKSGWFLFAWGFTEALTLAKFGSTN